MKNSTEHTYHNIMLVEDDQRLADLIVEYMQGQGFTVQHIAHGDAAVAAITQQQPDLVILDIMLPGIDGFEICRQVRKQFAQPIMMLTAKDEDVDQIVGLEIGADDYVTKPVDPRVLLARIKSLLRRSNSNASTDKSALQIAIEGMQINLSSRQVFFQGDEIHLTGSEFDLLCFLLRNTGKVLSRDELYRAVSGIDYDGLDRAMDIRISRLRKLLDAYPEVNLQIKTVRGKGYVCISEAEI